MTGYQSPCAQICNKRDGVIVLQMSRRANLQNAILRDEVGHGVPKLLSKNVVEKALHGLTNVLSEFIR